MDSTDNRTTGENAAPSAAGQPSGNLGMLVRTRSGRLIRSDPQPATFRAIGEQAGRPLVSMIFLGVAIAALLGLLAFLVSSSPKGKGRPFESILEDVGFVIRQQKGPGLSR